MKYRVVVTGGCGFIGKKVAIRLINKGYEVVIVDIKNKCEIQQNSNYEYKKMNVLDIDKMANLLASRKPNALIHLIGQPVISECISFPDKSFSINAQSVHAVLEAMRRAQINTILYASTAVIYDTIRGGLFRESDLPFPSNIYGVHKYTGELLVKIYGLHYGIKSIILRLFNVYGNNLFEGKDVISLFIRKALKSEEIIVKPGRGYRDFIYVDDVGEAFVKSLELFCKIKNLDMPLLINVGSGVKTYIYNLAKEIVRIVGSSSRVVTSDNIEIGYYADVKRMKKFLNIEPMSLNNGLRKVVKKWLEK